MSPLLDGHVAVVSGVGPGLGRSIAVAMAREGASVVLAARSASYLDEVEAEITAGGGHAFAVPTDITHAGQCEHLVAASVERFGRIDCLVNSAFKPDVFQPFDAVDLDAWRDIFDVNVFGSLQLTQSTVAQMKTQGSGSIVFVNSMVVRRVMARQVGYAASKGALLTAAQGLARELGRHGIRVNSVVPGWIWGPNVQTYVEYQAARRGVSEQDVIDGLTKEMALGAIPTADEVADAVVFFASPLSRAITGQALDVNGGEVFA